MRERQSQRPTRRRGRIGSILLAAAAVAALLAGAAVAALVPAPAEPSGEPTRAIDLPAADAPGAPGAPEGPVAPAPTEGDRDDQADPAPGEPPSPKGGRPEIDYRKSKAVGEPWDGKLKRGVLLPREGKAWFSWDPIKKRSPNRQWRRWGTDKLIRTTVGVIREWGTENPRAPRLPIGDLSRTRGGDFGPQFGSIGHASHQNGLDVDIYYPRKDAKPKPPDKPSQVRVKASQDLVDRFVAAGAEKVFVGPSLPLTGPKDVVVPLVHHDNHIHVRIPNPGR